MVTNGCTCLAQGNDFGMSGGIAGCDVPIAAPPDDRALKNDDRSNGHFTVFERTLRFA
jgi:hypothetical protein